MPTTSPDNFPYPDNNSDASINVHIAALAGAVQAKVGPHILDTGWVDCPLISGTSQQGGSLPQVRRIGKIVYMRWGVSGTGKAATSASNVCTVPAGFRPDTHKYFVVSTNDSRHPARILVQPGGIVQLVIGSSTAIYIIFDSAWWAID